MTRPEANREVNQTEPNRRLISLLGNSYVMTSPRQGQRKEAKPSTKANLQTLLLKALSKGPKLLLKTPSKDPDY